MKQLSFLATDPSTNFRIGVICRLPTQCRCGENLTTIASSRGPHVGALLCCSCGRNRKWLSREEAIRVDESIKLTGNLAAPVEIGGQTTSETEGK
jgi:hypothetical protein